MTSIPAPAPLYRRHAQTSVATTEADDARFVSPLRRRRRTVRTLREQTQFDSLYIRHQII
jgi:hypothetical protein